MGTDQEPKMLPSRPTKTEIVDWVSSFSPETPLSDKFEIAANLFLEQALYAMTNMSTKDAMIAAGISVEKMQLLRSLPEEVKKAMPLLIKIANRAASKGFTLNDVLTVLVEKMG